MTSWYVVRGGGYTSNVSLSWGHKDRAEKRAEGQAGLGGKGLTCVAGDLGKQHDAAEEVGGVWPTPEREGGGQGDMGQGIKGTNY